MSSIRFPPHSSTYYSENRKKKMSTEKGNADISDNSVQPPSSENNLEKWHFGRALAYRAVYGSNHRKSRGNASKISPSRLSKVSAATNDKQDNN